MLNIALANITKAPALVSNAQVQTAFVFHQGCPVGALSLFGHTQRHQSLASPQQEQWSTSLTPFQKDVKCLALTGALVLVTPTEERCLPAGLAVPQTLPH